jgi:hypothetical protein
MENLHIQSREAEIKPAGVEPLMRQIKSYADCRRSLSVGHKALDGLQVRAVNKGTLPQTRTTLGILFGKDMAQILATTAELAAAGGAKTLGGGTASLDFWHNQLLKYSHVLQSKRVI